MKASVLVVALGVLGAGWWAKTAADEKSQDRALADAKSVMGEARDALRETGERLAHIGEIDEGLARAMGSLSVCIEHMDDIGGIRATLAEARARLAPAILAVKGLDEHREALETAQHDLLAVMDDIQAVMLGRQAIERCRVELTKAEGQMASGSAADWGLAAGGAKRARDEMATLAAILDSQVGLPHVTIYARAVDWEQRTRNVQTRQRNGLGRIVPVRDGGWFHIHARHKIEHSYLPITAMKIRITIRGMEGFQEEVDWQKSSGPLKEGSYSDETLRIFVAEPQVDTFWFKDQKAKQVSKELRLEVLHVRYEDGTELGYGR